MDKRCVHPNNNKLSILQYSCMLVIFYSYENYTILTQLYTLLFRPYNHNIAGSNAMRGHGVESPSKIQQNMKIYIKM